MDELQEFRKQIDALDEQILTLLDKRFGIVKQVGHMKQKLLGSQHSFIRMARESSMIKSMFAKNLENIDGQKLAHLWRMIINIALNIEHEMHIAHLPESKCHALEYFGAFSQFHECANYQDLVGFVQNTPRAIALIPSDYQKSFFDMPEIGRDGLQIFSISPLITKDHLKMGFGISYILANIDLEESGDDLTLVAVSGSGIDEKYIFSGDLLGYILAIPGFMPNISKEDCEKIIGSKIEQFKFLGIIASPIIFPK